MKHKMIEIKAVRHIFRIPIFSLRSAVFANCDNDLKITRRKVSQ